MLQALSFRGEIIMNFPKLQIQSTPARLGLNIQKPVQRIEQPQATLDIQQPKAIQTMKKTDPRLSIDTTEARADLDLKSGPRRVCLLYTSPSPRDS